jgi:hypothetical protein
LFVVVVVVVVVGVVVVVFVAVVVVGVVEYFVKMKVVHAHALITVERVIEFWCY